MVAQIDEQHAAMVADAVAPAGQSDGFTDMGFAEVAAGMGAIGVHGVSSSGKFSCGLAEKPVRVKGARVFRGVLIQKGLQP